MPVPSFQPNPSESVLYHSQDSRKWYRLAWNIAVWVFEVLVFLLFSFTLFTSLARALFATFLPAAWPDYLSWAIFQGLAPIFVVAWFIEETVRMFTCTLVLTNQRIWTKGSPYAWSPVQEISLEDVKSISARTDAIFIRLQDTKKAIVHVIPDGKLVVQTFRQFTGKTSEN